MNGVQDVPTASNQFRGWGSTILAKSETQIFPEKIHFWGGYHPCPILRPCCPWTVLLSFLGGVNLSSQKNSECVVTKVCLAMIIYLVSQDWRGHNKTKYFSSLLLCFVLQTYWTVIPMHEWKSSSSCLKPGWHSQRNPPNVFTHVALSPQTGSSHSSMSEMGLPPKLLELYIPNIFSPNHVINREI